VPHYAKVRKGVVTQVIVAEPEFFDTFVDTEPGEWIQTSYNMRGGVLYDNETNTPAEDQSGIEGDPARMRKNFAAVGYTYDAQRDVFIPYQPFPSWVLDEENCKWEAPIPRPVGAAYYRWDEDAYQADTNEPKTAGWVEVTDNV
jgi:hypothetical protein